MSPAIVLLTLALGQVAGAGPVLTLDEALKRAEQNSTDLRAARARLGQAREISRKAWAGYLPQISLGASYNRNNEVPVIPFPMGYMHAEDGVTIVPDPAQVFPVEIQKTHQWGAQLQATQGILIPSLWPAIHNAYLAEKAAELGTEAVRREVLFAVAQTYYGLVTLQESLAVHKQLVETARAHEADSSLAVQTGTAPPISLVRAQMLRTHAEQDVLRTQNALASARLALAMMVGCEPDFDVVRPTEPAVPALSPELEEQALRARPDVRAAQASLDLAQAADRWTWLNYLPNLVATGSYYKTNVAGFTGQTEGWSVGLALTWTLWDGGLRESAWRENAHKLAEARANRDGLERRTRTEVQQAILDFESSRANYTKAVEQAKLARENMKVVHASFRAGTVTQLNVSDATDALAAAEMGLLNEALNQDLSALKLLKVIGAFDPK